MYILTIIKSVRRKNDSLRIFSGGLACFVHAAILALLMTGLTGCYAMRGSAGGGQTSFEPPRRVNAADIALPDGYRIEPVAAGLTFPTGVTFDASGTVYMVESGYSYGEVWTAPQLLRVQPDGTTLSIARGGRNGPWTGVVYHEGAFYVAEGGVLEGGRILRITAEGQISFLLEGLPSHGDHHTNGPAVGSDGWLYFGQGTATNSGVVGRDNMQFGWLKRYPDFHDIPCTDIVLSGRNYPTNNFLEDGSGPGPLQWSRHADQARCRQPSSGTCCLGIQEPFWSRFFVGRPFICHGQHV
ncbi:MAG: hypothetical protein SCH71_04285 [Desulfobulbaceae bacterium]|nr:hypothetical protein [Desulfobulbaceae bacterium]